jgi:hypothetical protein
LLDLDGFRQYADMLIRSNSPRSCLRRTRLAWPVLERGVSGLEEEGREFEYTSLLAPEVPERAGGILGRV